MEDMKEKCRMQVSERKVEIKWKRGDSPEIFFEGLGLPFKLQSLQGGEIYRITIKNERFQDDLKQIKEHKEQIFRHGSFIIKVNVSVPHGEPEEAREHILCGA